jgi:hypothetical protein
MRATEFIRELLDLIDKVNDTQSTAPDYENEVSDGNPETTQYSNAPGERVTPLSTILSIGNDVNKPKNPADIRADSFSMYPNWQAKKD